MTRREERIKYVQTFKVKDVENEELKDIIRLAILDGAIWADKTMIDKACAWLEREYAYNDSMSVLNNELIEAFRKAMEE